MFPSSTNREIRHFHFVKEAMEYKLERLNTTLIRSIYNTPIVRSIIEGGIGVY